MWSESIVDEKEICIMQEKKRLLSTSYIKAAAIMLVIVNHTLNYTKTTEQRTLIGSSFFLNLWLYQAVSLFIIIVGYHYAQSMSRIESFGGVLLRGMIKKHFGQNFHVFWCHIPYNRQHVSYTMYLVEGYIILKHICNGC